MEVSPQEEMANPQGMRMFAVERLGLSEDFVSFRALCGVQSSPLVFAPNRAVVWGPLRWYRERLCASGLRSPELSAQARRPNSCTSCISAHMDGPNSCASCFHYAHRSKRLSESRGPSRTAAESVCDLDVNQRLSQPTNCIPLTPHKAPEFAKLLAASYVGVLNVESCNYGTLPSQVPVYGEYVVIFSLTDGVFLPCDHGLVFDISLWENSLNRFNGKWKMKVQRKILSLSYGYRYSCRF